MITTMEIAAYIFFIALLAGSFIIGAYLNNADKKRLKDRNLSK
jgi:hypothetical protein